MQHPVIHPDSSNSSTVPWATAVPDHEPTPAALLRTVPHLEWWKVIFGT